MDDSRALLSRMLIVLFGLALGAFIGLVAALGVGWINININVC